MYINLHSCKYSNLHDLKYTDALSARKFANTWPVVHIKRRCCDYWLEYKIR